MARTTPSPHFRIRLATLVTTAAILGACAASPVLGAGAAMFSTSAGSTGEKPQSKLWYHDGSYWAVLKGPSGLAIYRLVGSTWQIGSFADAVLTSGGKCDVKWNGTNLLVLAYTSSCKLFEYTYAPATHAWVLTSGFPVTVPHPSGSETMVLEQDSTGRLWTTAEGGNNVNVYYSTSADHKTWSSTPVVLQTGINSDDITSVVAFGGDKIGIFWSDQNRDEFGFRIHHDGDAPSAWDPEEVVYKGTGHADDHIHLAFDSSGRVYAVTKDDYDQFAVHRRGVNGGWTLKTDIAGGNGTRPIIMVAEADSKVYVLYTRWGSGTDAIEYRVANINDLVFGGQTTFISSSSSLNNVTGMKQLLPSGGLIAVAESGSQCWWNGFGAPPPSGPAGPAAPQNLVATLKSGPVRADVTWASPSGAAPDGYNVYRQVNGGPYVKLNPALVTGLAFSDAAPPLGHLCYEATSVANGSESTLSAESCVDLLAPPPGPPLSLTAARGTIPGGSTGGAAAYAFDEGSGQTVADATGHGHTLQLGASAGVDASDPIWTAGKTGSALVFDGSSQYALVPTASDLGFAASFTLEAWFQRAATGAAHCILSKGDSNRRNYWIVIDGSNRVDFRWETSGGSNRGTTSSLTVTDAGWHHVACVYDQTAGQDRIYLDGALIKSASDSGTPVTNTDPLYVGTRTSSGKPTDRFKGAVDLVRLSAGVVYTSNFTPPTSFGGSQPQQIVSLGWQPPSSGTSAGYNVYRSVNGGGFSKLNTSLVASPSYADAAPPTAVGACYQVTAVDASQQEGATSDPACVQPLSAAILLAGAATSDAGEDARVVANPNPFNPETAISFRVSAPGRVFVGVYDVCGRRVATLADGPLAAGRHVVRWAGRDDRGAPMAGGVYFAVVRTSEGMQRHKLVYVK